ncbi:hypothetical protein MMC32_007292 [Xylographa parallela]|nr:hypothetical protein [Xylographa parallela]
MSLILISLLFLRLTSCVLPGPIAGIINIPIDHFDPSDTRTYGNRYWMNDTYYQKGGPVFLYDNGEAGIADSQATQDTGGGSASYFAPLELAIKYHGILILWEHRFYGGSLPFEINETTGLALAGYDAYKYLNNEQAMEDVVYLATHFQPPGYSKKEGAALSSPLTPWIWIGGSYAGTRAARSRIRNPDVFFASWSSSGPLQNVVADWTYYNPIAQTMPANCSADVQAAIAYADHIITDGSADEVALLRRALFIANNANPKDNAGISTPEDLSYWRIASILAYPFQGSFFNFQTFGYALGLSTFCRQLETWTPFNSSSFNLTSPPSVITNNTDDSPATAAGIAATHGPQNAFYALLYAIIQKGITDYQMFPGNPRAPADTAAWFWQLCSEFGEFQVSSPHNAHNLVSRFYSASATETNMCYSMFPYVPARPNIEAFLKYGGWDMKPSNVMFTNGGIDPIGTIGIQATTEQNPQAPNRPSTTDVPRCGVPPRGNQVYGQVWPGQVHGSDFSPNPFTMSAAVAEAAVALFGKALDVWLPCFEGKGG